LLQSLLLITPKIVRYTSPMKKVIVITGGSDGFGKAVAQNLRNDFTVVILGREKNKTEKVAREIGVDFVVADITDPRQVKQAIESVVSKYAQIDVLVNNAGVWIQGLLEENDDARIRDTLDVNVYGTILVTKYAVPFMKSQRTGKIIKVISQAGLNKKAERSVYNASKWALTGFTKSLQLELGIHGISVCGFYPGAMKTSFFSKAGIEKDTKNYMNPDEVAKSVRFIIEAPDNLDIPEFGIQPIE